MPAATSTYRSRLPQLDRELFLTDGGLETTLIFHEGIDLPLFAAVGLLESEDGRAALRKYFDTYAALAVEQGVGIVLEAATWRANPDWGAQLGYSLDDLDRLNRAAIDILADVRAAHETGASPIVISGCIGPR